MLYFLLTIIAIGVLLASPEGKRLLGWLAGLGILASVACLVFGVVIIIIWIFSDNWTYLNDEIIPAIGGLGLIVAIYYYGNYLVKKVKDKEKRAEITAKLKDEWRKRKARFIFVVALVLIIIFCWIIIPIIL